jgi:N utilization substance protein B
MLFEKLPKEIAINEALNLTKIYSNLDDDKQVKFNNKLLDKISKEVQ